MPPSDRNQRRDVRVEILVTRDERAILAKLEREREDRVGARDGVSGVIRERVLAPEKRRP